MSEESDAVRKGRIKAATVQAACDLISKLTSELPHEQAKIITSAIETVKVKLESDLKPALQPAIQPTVQPTVQPSTRTALQPDLKTDTTPLFTWDKLPGEVKNTIYKLLLVSDKPIRPVTQRAARHKPNIQGKVLRLSKSIYKEALPIMLGDNIFILNSALDRYLGYLTTWQKWLMAQDSKRPFTSPSDRAAMVRKLAIESNHITPRQKAILPQLTGLSELFFIPKCIESKSIDQVDAKDWEKICASNHRSFATKELMDLVRRHSGIAVYLIGFQDFEDAKKVSSSFKD